MRDVNPLCFPDLLLQMCGSYIVGSICFKDQLFGPFTYWLGFSPEPREFRVFSHFFELADELIHSLTDYLEIPGNLYNGLLLRPLLNYPQNIPIR